MNTFFAATREELTNTSMTSRIMGRFHIKNILPHTGEIALNETGIVMNDWKSIKWSDIKSADIENDKYFSSVMVATQSRLFFSKSAKPIKLQLTNDEVVYFYVDWNFATGLSNNKKVFNDIQKYLS